MVNGDFLPFANSPFTHSPLTPSPSLRLTHTRLRTWWQCRRRFQLAFVIRQPWPMPAPPPDVAQRLALGDQFHRWAEQYLLGLPESGESDGALRDWQDAFRQQVARLPQGQRFPELSLSVPIGRLVLFGRFDLLLVTPDAAWLWDWKTEQHPRSPATLANDWQIRLYSALVVAGASALGHTFRPDQVHATWWFANDPRHPVTIPHSVERHRETWATITATAEQIERHLENPHAIWPLTDDLSQCATCPWHTLCGRPGGAANEAAAQEEWLAESADLPPADPALEPALP
jgi:hypothetical protein